MKRLMRPVLIALVLAGLAAPKLGPKLWTEVSAALGTGRTTAGQPSAASSIDSNGVDRGGTDPSGSESAGRVRRAAPVRVSATMLKPVSLAEIVTSTGTLLPDEGVELQAETDGRITSINFAEGARVGKGDLLIKLNDADLQAMRTAAVLELELAERRERRAAELLAQGFVRADEHDMALSTVRVRSAEIALTEARIAKTEIRAPFDGIAGLRYVSEGAFVTAASRIATLQRTDTLKIEFSVPEKYGGRIALGSSVAFTVAGRAQEFVGKVYAQEPRIDAVTRTLLIRAVCPNPGGSLLPGTFANVKLTLTETADALLVPAGALIPELDATYLFVLVDGKAVRRSVVTGVRTDSRVQILGGVAPGDIVITSGLQQIRPGSAVEAQLIGDFTISNGGTSPPAGARQAEGVAATAAVALRR